MKQPARHPALWRLDALEGEWELQADFGGNQVAGGRTRFEWLEGEPFLIQRVEGGSLPPDAPAELRENSPEPVTTLIGLDDSEEQYTMLYSDARDVFRVYQMTLQGRQWKLWRSAPGFHQRFSGTFSDDGTTITGKWEHSPDGENWEHDFDLKYVKI